MPLTRQSEVPPLGVYLTDGDQLIYVLESDHSGLIGEDCATEELVGLTPYQLRAWRRVHPAVESSADREVGDHPW